MYVPGMICFTLVVSLLLAQTEGRAFNNVQSREKRQTSGCDGGTRYDYFGPISTNIGGEYGNNENCCWDIVPDVQGTWTITFQFSSFDVESSFGCRYDALTFNTDDGPVKECGQKTDFSRTFVVNGSQFEVCFSSDGSVTGQGVSGAYSIDTVNVDATSNPAYTTAYPDYTTSYPYYSTAYPYYSTAYPYYSTAYPYYSTAYPDYSTAYPDYSTAYPYYSTAYPYYSTAYPDYSTAYPDYAIYYSDYTTSYPDYATAYPDYVTAYPDYATAYPDYATAYPDYITAYPDYITVYPEYTTAYPEYPQEPVTTSGNTSYYGNLGSISINADGNYENSQDTCYSLHPSFTGSGIITFVFNVFDIEEATGCVFDYIEFDGLDKKLRECGTVDAGTQREFEFHDGRFNVCFHSDGSVTGRGVQATYSMNPVRRVESVETTPYPVDVIFNATMSTNFTEATTLPVNITVNATSLPDTEDNTCTQVLTSDDGALTSPGNGSYANNVQCVTVITGPSVPYTLVLSFTTFDLEYSSTCRYDYLEVDMGEGNSQKGCGSTWDNRTVEFNPVPPLMIADSSDGGNVTLTFSSDSSQTGAGYIATYTIQPRGVPSLSNGDCRYINTNVTAGVIQSLPGTGSDYTNNMDCSYEFTRNTPFYLDINFIALDTESSSNCRYDYVQVGDDKYCGSDLPNATRVSVQGGSAIIRFRSDSSVTGKGFVALFTIEEHCNSEIDDLEGIYTLATDSEDHYKNNQHCDITLRSPPTPHITTVNFTRFDIEDDSGCDYDSLTITSDESTEKLCGAKESFIRQYTGPVDMTFTSDGSVVRSGFSFSYVTEIVYCNATINAPSGTFESLPGGYENNMYCTYTINTPGPGDLVFTFPLFDVESGSSCRYDAVEMAGDKLCGTNIQDKTYSTDGHFQFLFTSDGSVTEDGFRIDFNFTPSDNITTSPLPTLPVTTQTTTLPVTTSSPDTDCNSEIDDLEGIYTLATDSEDHYTNNQHCDITLRSPPTPHITTVNFTRFDIEDDSGCDYDSLTITSDDGTEKLCGAKESFIRQYTGPVDMTFTSDGSVVRSGFSFSYVTEIVYCNATINAPSGTFESLPGGYENNMYCTYTINTPGPGDLVFTFPLFDVESGSSCRYDAVEMAGDKLCGTNIQDKTYSTDGHFQFLFTSDGSVTEDGFRIDFNFTPSDNITTSPLPTLPVTTQTTTLPVTTSSPDTDCNSEIDDLEGIYTLATDSEDHYTNNQHCDITLRSPPTPHITTVNFTRFDIEDDSGCDYDSLTITSDDGTEKLCGAKESFIRQYTGPVDMTFTSDGSVVRSGFSFSYVTEIVYCNATINAPSGTFESLPGGYENNMYCTYTINTPGPGDLVFTFPLFDVESGSSCRYDAVEMAGDKLCGTNIQDKTYSTDGHFQFLFTSDGSVTEDGFRIDFNFTPSDNITTSPLPTLPVTTQTTTLPVTTSSPDTDCNSEIDDLEGIYTLATDSEDHYTNNQHCDITLRSPPTPHITTVNFTRFDIEDDSGCDYDSLTITSDDGTEKLCGAKESFIRQYTGPVDMTFTSDGSVVRSGFSFSYVTEIVYCNATINAPSGTFESLPGGYENNMYCTYTINTPGPGDLVFTFPLFDVESGSSCRYDAVEMAGDKLCGTNIQDKTYSTDGHFQFLFTSDGSVTEDGFRIDFNFTPSDNITTSPLPTLPVTTQTTTLPVTTSSPDTDTCTQVLTSDVGTLTSPGNGSYANNVQCVTVITGPSVPYTLVLSFTTFDLEYSSTCRYDYLEVDMGEGNSQKGCGSTWDNRTVEYTSDGGNVTVTFSSDSSQTGVGYSATYTILPRGVPSLSNGDCLYINSNVSAGVIQSLPGTGSDYTNNMDCSYEFTRNTPFYLDINFIALDTESSSDCRYDYVQVGDDKYCGSDLPNATRVSAQGGSAIIRFRSDSSVTGKGFVALFTIEEHCNFDSEDLEGTYTLATDSEDHYRNNQHCDITLRSPPTPHITTVNFTRFDIEDDSGCDYDSLTITSDDGAEKLCGAKESFIRQYTGPTVDMAFTSDGSVVRSGFAFNYVTELVYCNATINATSGTFESQPGGYENNMYCTYTINTPTPGDLVFTFPLFDVESGSSCRYDAVEMEGNKLCGTNIQEKTYSTDGHFQFVFTSDGSVNGEGFKIDFTFIPHEIQN